MSNGEDRPLSALVAQGWEVVGYSTRHSTSSGMAEESILLRRQRAHKVLTIRRKALGSGYVVKEMDI